MARSIAARARSSCFFPTASSAFRIHSDLHHLRPLVLDLFGEVIRQGLVTHGPFDRSASEIVLLLPDSQFRLSHPFRSAPLASFGARSLRRSYPPGSCNPWPVRSQRERDRPASSRQPVPPFASIPICTTCVLWCSISSAKLSARVL